MSRKDARRESDANRFRSEDQGYLLKPAKIEVGSGYTFSVRYGENENPVIDLKTYGNVSINRIVKEIRRAFPEAQIRKINGLQTFVAVKRRKSRNIERKLKPTFHPKF